ncbi:hypothetical protein B0H13DRAFT_2666978 [Mycena leptocephala]|nr:hypothetical protein B0H13DRAFT_2666978 [Mycena leptocephala]
MPPSSAEIDSLLEYTRLAARTLQDVASADASLLKAVSGATLLVIPLVQDVKANKERCVRMIENIHQLLCTLTVLSLDSGSMTPLVLDDIGSLARFYACLRSQQEFGKIRRFFKQMEITAQLGACEAELESVLDSFKVTSRAISSMAVTDLCAQAAQRHQEILELLETYSISQYSDSGSLVTMRGAERPGNVKWTRPFLPPLEPISASASRQTFVDIVDEPKADEEAALVELIELTGNLPLAVGLLANVASLRATSDAGSSNLEKSLAVSLTSPRIKSNPHALGLLSLLSLLPDGISVAELHSSHVPLSAVSRCRTTLVQTSLAFIVDGRVKALSPIRDYMRSELLKVWDTYYGLSPKDLVTQLTSHLGNIQSLFLNSITTEGLAQPDVGYGILNLQRLSEIMLKGVTPLLEYLPGIIDSTHDHHLKWRYVRACVEGIPGHPLSATDVDALMNEGTQYFIHANDQEGQAGVYLTLSSYYDRVGDIHKCLEFNKLGMDLATKINHPRYQIRALLKKALIESTLGKYHESIMHLREVQKLARVTGRVNEECSSVGDEAIPLCRLGRFTEALESIAEGHDLLIKNGLQGSDIELGFLDRKAEIHFQKSEYPEARRLTERVVRMTARHRSPYFHANAVRTLAQIDIVTGVEDSVILQTLIAARELARELRWPHALVMCDISQYELDIRSGDGAKAYTSLKCLVTKAELDAEVMFLTLESLGELSHGMCGVEETLGWATTYFAFARKTQDLGHTYQALRYLGDTFLAQRDEETALSVFQAVLDGSTKMDVHRRRADCMSRIGEIFLCRGDVVRAKEMWEAARPLFVRSSRAKDVTAVDSKLAQLEDIEPAALSNHVGMSVVSDHETAKDFSSCKILGRQSVNQL